MMKDSRFVDLRTILTAVAGLALCGLSLGCATDAGSVEPPTVVSCDSRPYRIVNPEELEFRELDQQLARLPEYTLHVHGSIDRDGSLHISRRAGPTSAISSGPGSPVVPSVLNINASPAAWDAIHDVGGFANLRRVRAVCVPDGSQAMIDWLAQKNGLRSAHLEMRSFEEVDIRPLGKLDDLVSLSIGTDVNAAARSIPDSLIEGLFQFEHLTTLSIDGRLSHDAQELLTEFVSERELGAFAISHPVDDPSLFIAAMSSVPRISFSLTEACLAKLAAEASHEPFPVNAMNLVAPRSARQQILELLKRCPLLVECHLELILPEKLDGNQ